MTSVMESTQDLMDVFAAKLKDFSNEIDDVHIVWLEEIGQAALKMFSSDFSTEPELMPKTPSQKKSSRRRRVSVGQTESKAKKGLSKSRRSNLRRSSAHQAGLLPIHEDLAAPEEDATEEEPQRKTRRNNNATKAARGKQNAAAAAPSEDEAPQEEEGMTTEPSSSDEPPQVSQAEEADAAHADVDAAAVVPDTPTGPPVRNSVRRSTASRRSLAGLRRSLTQEAVRRASRRSFLKKKARLSRSASSSVTGDDIVVDTDGEEVEAIQGDEVFEEVEPAISLSPVPDETVEPDMAKDAEQPDPEPPRYTRSMARNTPTDASTVSLIVKAQTPSNAPDNSTKAAGTQSASRFGFKRKVDPAEDAPKKKASPRAKQSAVKPNMKSFIHTVQKNQLLMMTPGSAGRSSVMSFIKHSTPGRVDPKQWYPRNKMAEFRIDCSNIQW
ncbi:inner centromere protein A-like [Engraulis encrasicolus]|uniref:inner centromere protein A-like n=1 Tax=Engraulis encrasicolus TaxID=184585 RepID=UPI002FD0703F